MANKRVMVVMTLVAVSVVGLGTIIASNMGFVILYHLDGPGEGSASGTNVICLPYLPKEGLETADDLIEDIGSQHVVSVSKFVRSTDGLQTYTGYSGANFNLVPGEAYYVKVNADVDYEIRGSHDPDEVVSLLGPDGGLTSLSGANFFCPPYHFVATDASELINEIGPSAVVSVSKSIRSTDGLLTYTGHSGANFGLVPGEGYHVKVSSDVDQTPSHY